MDSDTIADIDAFLRLDIGDAGRLNSIKAMLQDGRELYNSDRKYLRVLKNRYSGNVPKTDTQNPDGMKDNLPENDSMSKPEIKAVQKQIPRNPILEDAVQDREPIIIINQPRDSSAAWYLLPVFLLMVGGLISYLCLRKQDPPRARKTLILGIFLSVIPVLMLTVVLEFVYEGFEDTRIQPTDMTYEQIRQSALVVPYDLLMEESGKYQGEVILYEGDVEQVMDNFHSYMLRVAVSDELFVTNSIWSNFDPDTDEQRQWVQSIEKKHDPFGQDPDHVRIYGLFTGLREYDTILGSTLTVPEVDVYILEKIQP